jgi:hypothetical protein
MTKDELATINLQVAAVFALRLGLFSRVVPWTDEARPVTRTLVGRTKDASSAELTRVACEVANALAERVAAKGADGVAYLTPPQALPVGDRGFDVATDVAFVDQAGGWLDPAPESAPNERTIIESGRYGEWMRAGG